LTKHELIYETLQRRIQSGVFQPGDRIPSDAELVKEFNVSRPTVMKALQALGRRGIVERRPGSGTYVSKMQRNGGRHFGLLIPGLGETEIFEPICAEMASCAQEISDHLLLSGSTPNRGASPENMGELALEMCRQYIHQKVAGIFVAPLELTPDMDRLNRQIIAALENARIPIVLLDRDYLPHPERSRLDLVGIENRSAGHLITTHLLEQGCTRIAFVARPQSANTIDLRVDGFRDAFRAAGRHHRDAIVRPCEPRDRVAVAKILKTDKPDGIVCGNDVTAAHLMHCLGGLGVSVPDDILVAGIDDVRYAELLRVPLTTVHQPCAAIGRAAFGVMLDRLESPDAPARDVLLRCELVVRESTRRKN
jgi:DNA-binding LacI/PurR family transcriptional regulator